MACMGKPVTKIILQGKETKGARATHLFHLNVEFTMNLFTFEDLYPMEKRGKRVRNIFDLHSN